MGMFDDLRCHYPLPIKGVQDRHWQTKDTPAQWLDQYEIREDGSLWHEDYDIEDRSDPNATGISGLIGMMTRVNKRWEPCEMTGEIRFYGFRDEVRGKGWIEFSAYFVAGKLRELHLIEDRSAETVD